MPCRTISSCCYTGLCVENSKNCERLDDRHRIYNMADAVIVGKFVGNQALAAVGSCQRPVGIFVSIFWLSAILQILQQGKRQHDDAKDYKNDTGCTV